MLRELAWLHTQMNRELRETFAPLFALFEIKTIVLCLRNRAIGRTGEITRLLAAERLWVTELRHDERSLESLFLELTSDTDAVGEREEVSR